MCLSPDRSNVRANKTDVVHIEITICDKNDVILPEANHLVEFEISGPAKLLGVENGDILDLAPHKVLSRKAFKGKCLLLIQTTDEQGEITIKAHSKGLESAITSIVTN